MGVGLALIYGAGCAERSFDVGESYYDESTLIDLPPSDYVAVPPLYGKDYFFEAIGQDYVSTSQLKEVSGMIVNHHDIASGMIARGYAELQAKRPDLKTIIVLGPNHTQMGDSYIASGRVFFETPQKQNVYIDHAFIEELEQKKLIGFESEIMQIEHSTAIQMPFIAYYFPNARVIPLIFQADYYSVHSQKIVNALYNYAITHEDVAIIATVDFSHYLPTDLSNQKDRETIEYIKNWDTQTLLTFKDDHLDGRSTITAFMSLMQRLGATDIDVIDHKNSADILGRPLEVSTGYYTILFGRK
ncbi:AmmeMemoRadiSam system protein B [Candidatus Nomurabacteria bacterium]|nr:AmmeMemoRadiSam system protein B [Candidatus Nomurabacteria bacterium]